MQVQNALVRSTSTRRRGVAAFFVLISLMVLLGFAALTVDVGYMYNTRTELQNAADAMALAGASALELGPAAVRDRAQEFADQRSGLARLDMRDEDIVLGHWDKEAGEFITLTGDDEEGADTVRVFAQMTSTRENSLQLFFASILGRTNTDVSASATATFGTQKPWNVVIVQDITNSFVNELDEARVADQALLDCIRNHSGDETQVGLVAFTGFSLLVSPLQPLSTGYADLSDKIADLRPCDSPGMPVCSGTHIGIGLDLAIDLLVGLDSDLPPAIVLVSDGEPNSTDWPGYTNDDLKDWAIASANTAGANGISIFTLFYTGNDTAPGAVDFLAGLARGKGTAHNTPDPDEIGTKLEQICREALDTGLMLVQ